MVKMLADKYGLICCGENYDCIPEGIVIPETYPNLSYFQTLKDWQEFVNRTPQEYHDWIVQSSREQAEFEIIHLISISQTQKVIVDTNIMIPKNTPTTRKFSIVFFGLLDFMICSLMNFLSGSSRSKKWSTDID